MPAPLQVKLSESEDLTLEQLSLANSIPRRTKQRAIALRLNNQGRSVEEVSHYLKCAPQTVRKAIHRWDEVGLMGLWDEQRPGRKRRWNEEDWRYLKKCLEEECSYTSLQLAQKLKQERKVELGAEQIRRILKKKNWRWKRIRRKPPLGMSLEEIEAKKKDLEMLKKWAEMGLITLMYLDESGCYPQSPLVYSYGKVGEQKIVHQKQRKGRRINIMGLWEPNQKLEYGMIGCSFKTNRYIQFLDAQAQKAMKRLFETGMLTVIVNDNASIHTSLKARERHSYWEKQGLLIFFQASYHPQMNRMEDQWLHLKRDELRGRVFEDEYDLVEGIIEGMNHRGSQGGFEVERFIFN